MGKTSESLVRPPHIATVASLAAFLRDRDDAGRAAFGNAATIRAAVNLDFAGPDTAIADGDEIAFFPPVTGG